MERKVLDVSKKATPNEMIKRMVSRVIKAHYNIMPITAAVKYDANCDFWNFEVYGYSIGGHDWHLYGGFIGCLGQVTITNIDGMRLEIDEFEEVLG